MGLGAKVKLLHLTFDLGSFSLCGCRVVLRQLSANRFLVGSGLPIVDKNAAPPIVLCFSAAPSYGR